MSARVFLFSWSVLLGTIFFQVSKAQAQDSSVPYLQISLVPMDTRLPIPEYLRILGPKNFELVGPYFPTTSASASVKLNDSYLRQNIFPQHVELTELDFENSNNFTIKYKSENEKGQIFCRKGQIHVFRGGLLEARFKVGAVEEISGEKLRDVKAAFQIVETGPEEEYYVPVPFSTIRFFEMDDLSLMVIHEANGRKGPVDLRPDPFVFLKKGSGPWVNLHVTGSAYGAGGEEMIWLKNGEIILSDFKSLSGIVELPGVLSRLNGVPKFTRQMAIDLKLPLPGKVPNADQVVFQMNTMGFNEAFCKERFESAEERQKLQGMTPAERSKIFQVLMKVKMQKIE